METNLGKALKNLNGAIEEIKKTGEPRDFGKVTKLMESSWSLLTSSDGTMALLLEIEDPGDHPEITEEEIVKALEKRGYPVVNYD